MIYTDGTAISPDEQIVLFIENARFALSFEPLPADCKKFWLWEESVEPFAFAAFEISRSDTNEYWVELVAAPY